MVLDRRTQTPVRVTEVVPGRSDVAMPEHMDGLDEPGRPGWVGVREGNDLCRQRIRVESARVYFRDAVQQAASALPREE